MNRTRIDRINLDLKNVKIFNLRLSAFYLFLLFSSTFLISACSSGLSSIYNFDYPLTKTTAKSTSGNLNAQIPVGWFVAEDNENNTTDLWLIKDDYSATIKFVFISLNEEMTKSSGKDVISRIVELNKVLIKSKYGKSFKGFTNEEQFGDSPAFSAYQYLDDKNIPVRVVVFNIGSNYFESTAFGINSTNPAEIFKAQNSILASIK